MNHRRYPGFFLVLEGLSGAGKTTLLKLLTFDLEKLLGSENIVQTQEPWRQTSTIENKLVGMALLDFVEDDRTKHVAQLITPSLQQGKGVLSSRYYMSELVYQGYLDSLGMQLCYERNKGFPVPDLTVFLYADEATIERRLGLRSNQSRFEQREYRARERYAYLEAVKFLRECGHRILSLDTTHQSPEQLVACIIDEIRA